MAESTVIEGAAWAVLWDAVHGRQVYGNGVDIAFEGDQITFVGRGFHGPAAKRIDGSNLFVLPGFVNIHSHAAHEPAERGIREEHFNPHLGSGLYERMAAFWLDDEGQGAAAEVAYCEMIRSGVTTVLDWSVPFDGWVEVMAKSGLRGYLTPEYTSAVWRPKDGSELAYVWKEDGGWGDFERAMAFVEQAENHPCGRLSGVVGPGQIDTCSEELLRASYNLAQEQGFPFTLHAAQLPREFQNIVERHGETPIQWAAELGLLGESTILGHAIYIDQHSEIEWHSRRDLMTLAGHGVSVAHCPSGFSRGGVALESFAKYTRAGVNLGIGTDQSPHNLIEEMRAAIIASRFAGDEGGEVGAKELLHAATVGGARALGREDLGKLAAGMKADLALVDLSAEIMRPVRDPLLSLIYHAADRAVRHVFVDGEQVLRDGQVLTLDSEDAMTRLEAGQRRMLAKVPEYDHAGRTIDEMVPLSLPLWG